MAGTHSSGSADDTLAGGAGVDTFLIGPDNGDDTITDFTNGEDVIDLKQFPTISRFSDLTITSNENGVTIDLSAHGGGTILLSGFAIANLDSTDFVFSTLDGGGTHWTEGIRAPCRWPASLHRSVRNLREGYRPADPRAGSRRSVRDRTGHDAGTRRRVVSRGIPAGYQCRLGTATPATRPRYHASVTDA